MIGYVGSFPPPYGGVTVKNDIWLNELKNEVDIMKVEFSKQPFLLVGFFFKLIYCKRYIVAISSNKKQILFARLWGRCCPKKIEKSIMLVMGGSFGKCIAANSELVKYFKRYKGIFVELESMRTELLSIGLQNVYYVPNCRKRPSVEYGIRNSGNRLKCVIFSLIFPEKGIDVVLEAASKMPDIDFFFYGEIKKGFEEYEVIFLEQIDRYENCFYCGIHKHEEGEVYAVLSQYDLLLFPTRWKNEGMPGTLIESKIAGLPAVVSHHAYNTELVTHMYDGIVMETNDADGLIAAIKLLNENRHLLMEMKKNAKKDSEKYFIDEYMDDVKSILSKS